MHGMDLSIYTKCLRIIKPEKFFIVDLVYEQFFKVKRKNYLEYKRAFQEVLDELKMMVLNFKLVILNIYCIS